MSKTMSSVYSAASPSNGVSPTVIGPDRGMKEVYIVGGGVLALAIGMGLFWVTTQSEEFRATVPADGVRAIPTAPTVAPVTPVVAAPIATADLATSVAAILPTQLKDTRHADVYFEFGRKGLSDEAKTYLTAHAAFLRNEPDWGVIIQGSTDARGSSTYNKKLGLQRADEVRAFLASLGIPDTSMKVVSLGKDGALCQDSSNDCRQLNRRVHLEFIKVGAAHMAPPVPVEATQPTIDSLSELSTGSNIAVGSTSELAPADLTIEAASSALETSAASDQADAPLGADGDTAATAPAAVDPSNTDTQAQHP